MLVALAKVALLDIVVGDVDSLVVVEVEGSNSPHYYFT